MREIVLDTETTGLSPEEGDRVVEIGALELFHRVPTGEVWHSYINPERDMPADAYRVHELSEEFLSDKPRFAEIAGGLLEFIADAPLVIHNAPFDAGFLNAEFARLGLPKLAGERLVDTLQMARKRFAGAPNSLDALCTRFEIDRSARAVHGALVDCRLLAEVYLHLTGGRQPGLAFQAGAGSAATDGQPQGSGPFRPPRPHAPTPEELAAHKAFIADLKDPVWLE